MNYTAVYPSPIGALTLCSDGGSITGLWLPGQKHFGGGVTGELTPKAGVPALALAAEWLDRYFAGEDPDPGALPLAPAGSAFRQRVWRLLTRVPRGEVTTYGALARQLGTASARAVGGAVGHNPVSIIIPCHRVVGADGSLTGYAGGLEAKLWLLRHEGAGLPGKRRGAL